MLIVYNFCLKTVELVILNTLTSFDGLCIQISLNPFTFHQKGSNIVPDAQPAFLTYFWYNKIMENFIILILSSGFAGAIAGGIVSMISQILERKWKNQNQLRTLKINTYSEIISIGGEYLAENAFYKLNNLVSKAFLICEEEVRIALINYMGNIALIHKKIEGKNNKERKEIITQDVHRENAILHEKLVNLMKKELDLA